MRFGICIPSARATAAKVAGWDFVEDNARGLLQGLVPDDQWTCPPPAALPVLAANVLVPGQLKVTGPTADPDRLAAYLATVARRAGRVGIETLVFGSGDARGVPPGFDRATADGQLVAFLRRAAVSCAAHGVTVVVEPLNRHECNVINTLAEAVAVVEAVGHPNCRAALHTWHLWMEHEPVAAVAAAAPFVHHVHVADLEGRSAPGRSGHADYRPIFAALKAGGYDRTISVESGPIPDFAVAAPQVLAFLRAQWAEA